jgi:hypothetical protein
MREKKKPHNPKENKFWMNEKMGFQYFYFSIEKKKNPQSYFLDVNMKLSTLSLILLKKTEKVLIFIYMKEK